MWLSEPEPEDQRVHLRVTGATETPLPAGLAPTALFEVGTGSLGMATEPGDVVRSAGRYLAAMAALPISAEDQAMVDELISERVVGTAKKRPLRRR